MNSTHLSPTLHAARHNIPTSEVEALSIQLAPDETTKSKEALPSTTSTTTATSSKDRTVTMEHAELPFRQVGLIGRDKELRILENAFRTTCAQSKRHSVLGINNRSTIHPTLHSGELQAPSSPKDVVNKHQPTSAEGTSSKRTLVLISGHSGGGKTALAMQVKRFASVQDSDPHQPPFHGFAVTGKCEISKMNAEQPYAGIKPALMELCKQILSLEPGEADTPVDIIDTPLNKVSAADLAFRTQESAAATVSSASSTSSSSTSSASLLSATEGGSHTATTVGTSAKEGSQQLGLPTPTPSFSEDPRQLSALRKLLRRGMTKGEVQALSNIIPDLPRVVFGDAHMNASVNFHDDASVMSASTNWSGTQCTARAKSHRIGYRAHGDRLKFALRKLIQIICNYCPLIFVIDDLQWADKASLDIVKSWMLDNKNSSLMIIGCYRSNLLEENDVLKTTLTSLDESKRERALRIVKLPVQDLEVHHVNEMLCRLLTVSTGDSTRNVQGSGADADAETDMSHLSKVAEELADVVHQKTAGNPFFVQRFLQSLVDEGLLKYNGSKQSSPPPPSNTKSSRLTWAWSWDDAEIRAKSPSTSSIIELMKDKLHQVRNARQILPIAACLGASFSHSTIGIVMRGLSIHSAHSAFVRTLFGITHIVSTNDIEEMLQTCEQEGLIETSVGIAGTSRLSAKSGRKALSRTRSKMKTQKKKRRAKPSTIYNFSHDKVQEAALDMVDEEQLSELKYRVGEILLFGLSEDELNERIFMIANLVNTRLDLIPDINKSERGKRVMMLNFDAGSKAVSCSSFHLASQYFRTAIYLLPENRWEAMQEETLQAYTAAAECAFVTSELDRARKYCNIIIESKCDMVDKIKAYDTLVDVEMADMHNDGDKYTALKLCTHVLAQLGYKLPKPGIGRTVHTIVRLLMLKRMRRWLTPKMIADMPLITNRKEEAVMAMMSKMITICFLTKPELIPFVSLQIVDLTFKYGASEYSPGAFMRLGVLAGIVIGDAKTRRVLGQRALELMARMDHPISEGVFRVQYYARVQHHLGPLEDMAEPFMDLYRLGMSVGDVDRALWSATSGMSVHIHIGTTLPQLDSDLATLARVATDFHQVLQTAFLKISWQKVLNLRGVSQHRILHIGDAFNEESEMEGLGDKVKGLLQSMTDSSKVFCCAFFGEYELGAKISCDMIFQLMKEIPGSLGLPSAFFHAAICFFAASHSKTANSKYYKVGKKCLQQLKRWEAQGNPNCRHYILTLKAEQQFLRGKHCEAMTLYKEAIKVFARHGYIHDQGLAHERLGDCCMACGREAEAKEYYKESMKAYDEWGSMGKVDDLNSKVEGIEG